MTNFRDIISAVYAFLVYSQHILARHIRRTSLIKWERKNDETYIELKYAERQKERRQTDEWK